MKNLLIVEDEKLIRQGLVTMAKRAPVAIEEIIECKNGEEALEVLRTREIDVMFTDIRMPKMDGIALIGHLSELAAPPKTIVVSGYDDFGYAVEALRGGVQDYLLKPVEREKVFELLKKLDGELTREKAERDRSRSLGRQQLRYLIINRRIPEADMEELEARIAGEGIYRICCGCWGELAESGSGEYFQLREIQDQSVLFVRERAVKGLLETELATCRVGISGCHSGAREIPKAYEEAFQARLCAFLTGKQGIFYSEPQGKGPGEPVPEQFVEQFVQLFGTDKVTGGFRQLEHYYFQARRGIIDGDSLVKATVKILEKLLATYKNVLEIDMDGYLRLQKLLSYQDAESFLEDFKAWALRMNEAISTEFGDYKNKEKISMAVAYIRENYDKELNMAMVSNHISMNYSLFSLSFKQYTGMNFVNYLKMIRITEAKRLLEETDEKVIDISQRVGYENEKHFMKTFKSVCGVSPSEYRRNMRLGKGNPE